ncbi:hypothetical protein AK830_g11788 [Neonectria ditissima]|uniref:Uncharacterized protein n=1 Tax=Neonectria ditissima TaxID=78410 RepID=A0A0P7B717_9HYPO|nr:hypothetical protein AK830_g11788 [Neonectria ditissima]
MAGRINKSSPFVHEIPRNLVTDLVKFKNALHDIYGMLAGDSNFRVSGTDQTITVRAYLEEPKDLRKELEDRGVVNKE